MAPLKAGIPLPVMVRPCPLRRQACCRHRIMEDPNQHRVRSLRQPQSMQRGTAGIDHFLPLAQRF